MTAPQVLVSGPYASVRTTVDPWDDTAAQLVVGQNGYVPDPASKAAFMARPGFILGNGGAALNASGGGIGIWAFVGQDGTTYNFFTAGGHLYRATTALATFTDVTPTTITIDGGQTTRVYLATFANSLIVNDGVNPPWVGTNLGSTPITATPISAGVSLYATTGAMSQANTFVQTAAFVYRDPSTGLVWVVPTETLLPFLTIVTHAYWAAYRLYIASGAGTTITIIGYSNVATEALAIAGLAAAPAGALNLGYFTVQAQSGFGWIGGTDALTGGAAGNPAQTTNYYPTNIYDYWSAFGPPVIYAGHLFWFCNSFNGVSNRALMLWSEANQPLVGYEQTASPGYTNFWNLIQTSPLAVYAGAGTDLALYYWRANSIGTIVGAPGAGFSSTATTDTVSFNVGTEAPGALVLFGDTFYFLDSEGRPWRLAPGAAPEPIWLQMRQPWTQNAAGAAKPTMTSYMATAVLQPELNLYVVAIWSPNPATNLRPTTLYVFDAMTGLYMGTWVVAPGIAISCLGTVRDANGNQKLAILGTLTAGGTTGSYLWIQSLVTDGNWLDNSALPAIVAQTGRLGYATDVAWASRKGTVLALSNAPVTVTVETPYTTSTVEATSLSPGASQDSTYRIPVPMDVPAARGIQVSVSPTTATSQWGLAQVQIVATPRAARLDDL